MRRAILLLATAFLVGFGLEPAAAEVVCRPDHLGTVSCPDVTLRPKPRPIYRRPVQALERVRAEPEARDPSPGFVPARKTRALGGTLLLENGLTGPCRPDMLGNLNCR